ncbi:Guanine nucleotide-binding protein subunit beta-1 [Hondaea fermentalgiana]|uniref:Guanine nucleotide-binding protein subunit beta-1 n=1 Tax=Hondaea fermentalgiana TaxID=2315210 RepID=A0A2R5G7U3_9STRA|nr:Guanine nucleotide-binding protein subunit beta-1 [Hondaea fermentalgiana]|eukprot:GBG26399.1 Guanine nucleotide-binding protein subunit beta-1 [Hondaea fermentalgiana]
MAFSPPSSPARRLDSNYEARLKSPGRQFRPSPSRRKSLLSSPGSSPGASTTPKRDRSVYSDRFIPSRSGTQLETGFSLLGADDNGPGSGNKSTTSGGGAGGAGGGTGANAAGTDTKEGFSTYSMLLRSELLGLEASPQRKVGSPSASVVSSSPGGGAEVKDSPEQRSGPGSGGRGMHASPGRNLFRFKAPRQTALDLKKSFNMSPIGPNSPNLMSSPRKAKRKIPKTPFKVLDAPALQDDFYLNLVDWSSQNVLAVGLGSCVYLWSACTSKVTKLCDLGQHDWVTSVCWTQRGHHIAIGTNHGYVELWDAAKCSKIRVMSGHGARVGCLSWTSNQLASGSRDRSILLRDVRQPSSYLKKLTGHKQEVCGLKWSFDDQQLASGGNDNKLMIWNHHSTSPVLRFAEHTAAVKAIAWNPHQNGFLASGGGTADRCIRFWNTLTGTPIKCIDTGSQVCNLMFAKNVNELVSTHGYSLNQIIIWRVPQMTKVATLTGHLTRVLYLACSPDAQTIVTGAGDETLRFWNVFPAPKNKDGSRLGTSLLFPSGADIR